MLPIAGKSLSHIHTHINEGPAGRETSRIAVVGACAIAAVRAGAPTTGVVKTTTLEAGLGAIAAWLMPLRNSATAVIRYWVAPASPGTRQLMAVQVVVMHLLGCAMAQQVSSYDATGVLPGGACSVATASVALVAWASTSTGPLHASR